MIFDQNVILLDDVSSTIKNPKSRLYESNIGFIEVYEPKEIEKSLEHIQRRLESGIHAVCCFSYNLGLAFQGLPPKASLLNSPLIRAWFFKEYKKLSAGEVNEWIESRLDMERRQQVEIDGGIVDVKFEIDQKTFCENIDSIHSQIREGETYQVNYTFNVTGKTYGSTIGLYKRLRQRQHCRYGALICWEGSRILSFSPELFLSKTGTNILTKPMKGTLSSREYSAQDLKNDKKNCAENVMVVDLLRNDLSRISKVGSVKTPQLFEVENVGDILQMTSSVTSEISPDITITELLRATFPCGSITGAPKKSTMGIISELEHSGRGIYCGSLGWFDATASGNKSFADFTLNVAIRTLEIDSKNNFSFGVGSGVTIDSDSQTEWNECLLKSDFFVKLPSAVGVFESMLLKDNIVLRQEAHFNRLSQSAENLGIPYNLDEIEFLVQEYICNTKDLNIGLWKIRVALSATGELNIKHGRLEDIIENSVVFWANDLIGKTAGVTNSNDPLLRHKTNLRASYDLAYTEAEKNGGFDAIFVNEKNEVTEGGRSNFFIKKKGVMLTPPLECGLLPGIMRAELLNSRGILIREEVIKKSDVNAGAEIYLCNALRGLFKVRLQTQNNQN
ncbi:bifunctional chorismate-binding protein/class IV aminotransferase [Betaproteobacteria bacterium]|nr:bifunctional chorismate-binding protein/class IV aminotransferase [Betaproteobacteria bacterium]